MNFNEIPRKYLLGGIIAMIAVLVVITAVNPGSLIFKDSTDYDALRKQAEDEAKQYEAMLAEAAPDYEASQQLLQKIASEDIVRGEVEKALQTNQKIVVPTISNSELKISERNDLPTVVSYINQIGSMVDNYNNEVSPKVNTVFDQTPDLTSINEAVEHTKALVSNIRGMEVPQSALEMHKAELVAYQKYEEFLNIASAYALGQSSDPWPTVYGNYAVIDNRMDVAKSEFDKLEQQYAYDFSTHIEPTGFALLKTANAQWAVVDVWEKVWEGIKVGLARSFATFSINMLDKLVGHIEKNFAIASQLYYSNDLGRFYSVEYLQKFVEDPLDQDIIKKFLPEYFCVNPTGGELKQIFTAKARANQGSDLVIDPNDPQFLTKLARLGGDERNYEGWWEDYYTTLAAQTQSQAEAAAAKEVLSPGLKSGRDIVNGQINKTMASIFNVQEAAISNTIGLGTNNADNPVSQIVAGVVNGLVNKFVFTPIGGGTSGGGIGIIAEQNVCLKTPQMKPVAALPDGSYNQVPDEAPDIPATNPPGSTPPFKPR